MTRTIRCPRCGTPIDAEAASGSVSCPACHANLRIAVDPEGELLAQVASAVRANPVATTAEAAEKLRRQLESLKNERRATAEMVRWVDTEDARAESKPKRWWAAVIAGLILVLAGAEYVVWALLCFLFAAALWFAGRAWSRRQHERRVAEVHEKYDARLADLETQIAELSAELDRLNADLNRPTRQL